MRVTVVFMLCVSVTLCGAIFYNLRETHTGQVLVGVASASASRAGVRGAAPVNPTSTPAPSVSVKWIPTPQEAKKRSEALKMQAPIRPD